MKRIIAFLSVLVLLFTACTQSPTSSVTLAPCFTSEVEITVDETSYGAYLSRFASGYWQIEMNEPATVRGLIFTISAGETEVGFDGLRFTFDTSRFPVGSVIAVAVDNLDRILSSPVEVINGEDQCLATGTAGEESYTLTLSKTYVPQKLELLDCGMCINFVSFSEVEKTDE